MRKFNVKSRDLALARSSSISKGIWYSALLAIIGLAGFIAKANPSKPTSSTAVTPSSSSTSSSLGGGYNVTSPALSAPPISPISPQQSLGSSTPQAPAPTPRMSATGAS